MTLGPHDEDFLLSQARDEETKKKVIEIIDAENLFRQKGIKQKGNDLIKLHLGGYYIWTRGFLTHSLVHVYTQIFKFREKNVPKEFNDKNDKVFVDVGANEGYWTLKAKEDNPSLQVIALEPNPIAFELMEKNFKGNKLQNVAALNVALGAKNGKEHFEIIKEVSSLGSFKIATEGKKWLTPDRVSTIQVSVITLDELSKQQHLSKIDLIKIDAEGAELSILEGGRETICRTQKLEIEYHTEELKSRILEILGEFEFKLIAHQIQKPGIGILFLIRN